MKTTKLSKIAAIGLCILAPIITPAFAQNIAKAALSGTWVLVETPDARRPVGQRIKFIDGDKWDVTEASPKTGIVIFHHGGTFSLTENSYIEHITYANKNTAKLIGTDSKFTIDLHGDTLTLKGIGNPYTEIWKKLP